MSLFRRTKEKGLTTNNVQSGELGIFANVNGISGFIFGQGVDQDVCVPIKDLDESFEDLKVEGRGDDFSPGVPFLACLRGRME